MTRTQRRQLYRAALPFAKEALANLESIDPELVKTGKSWEPGSAEWAYVWALDWVKQLVGKLEAEG